MNAPFRTLRLDKMTQNEAAHDLSHDLPLYAAAPKVYPQSVHGTYRRIKWIILCVTLGIYYFLPFVRWNRGPNEPSQAVLIDFAHRKFYFFFIEIWPQEVYYLTGLLILAAMTLFLMNALAGRVWCGYLCPQTVWTDLFFWTERVFEGDRRERMLSDAGPWTARRVRQKFLKHATWLLIAWWTGGAWVLYFSDAPTTVHQLATFQGAPAALIWIAILTTTTYVLAGFMREQVCVYMCPWPRIQAALTDESALNVTYRYDRGEPRTSFKKSALLRAHGEKAGDCIDCGQCMAVCPTGVDIRQGPSLGCIQCGLCIDACDAVMKKIERPIRLIAYDTDVNVARRLAGKPNQFRLIRSRTILYAAVIAIVGGVMLAALIGRRDMTVSAMHDRNPMFVKTADGSIRNALTIHIVNRESATRRFSIRIDRPQDARLAVIGDQKTLEGAPIVEVGPDQVLELRMLVTTPPGANPPPSQPLVFKITDLATSETATAVDNFFAP
jgi:cytochrome c oxidase accessory protein FixG